MKKGRSIALNWSMRATMTVQEFGRQVYAKHDKFPIENMVIASNARDFGLIAGIENTLESKGINEGDIVFIKYRSLERVDDNILFDH